MTRIQQPTAAQSRAKPKRLEELVQRTPLPAWIDKMTEHYQETGSYRPEDLLKVLGNQQKGVEVGSSISLTSMMQSQRV